MKKIIIFIIALSFVLAPITQAALLGQTLSGRILLQVEDNGEAWYVDVLTAHRYFLGRPADAFSMMRALGLGISNADLEKISVGFVAYNDVDSDNDSLIDLLEDAVGTDKNSADSDNDGFSDKQELMNGFNPNGSGYLNWDSGTVERLKGRILLQVENNGEAWYVNPVDGFRYFLGRPAHAFEIMRSFGLGITNADLAKIPTAALSDQPESEPEPSAEPEPEDITDNDNLTALDLINQQRVANGLNSLSLDSRLISAAQAHSTDMWRNGYLNFTSPSNVSVRDRVEFAGYNAGDIKVNIASGPQLAAEVVNFWLENSSTSEVLFGEEVDEMGLASAGSGTNTYWTLILSTDLDISNQQIIVNLSDLNAVRLEMLELLNQERAAVGLDPLVLDGLLNQIAQAHSDDMRDRNFYAHENPDGLEVDGRADLAGYEYWGIGENIALNQTSVEWVMDDWMNSPPHRENILNELFTEVGIGVSYIVREDGLLYVYWTQNFGLPK